MIIGSLECVLSWCFLFHECMSWVSWILNAFFNFIFAFFTANKFITIIVTQFFDPVQLFRFSFTIFHFHFFISPIFFSDYCRLYTGSVLSFRSENAVCHSRQYLSNFLSFFFSLFNVNHLILNNSSFSIFLILIKEIIHLNTFGMHLKWYETISICYKSSVLRIKSRAVHGSSSLLLCSQ